MRDSKSSAINLLSLTYYCPELLAYTVAFVYVFLLLEIAAIGTEVMLCVSNCWLFII